MWKHHGYQVNKRKKENRTRKAITNRAVFILWSKSREFNTWLAFLRFMRIEKKKTSEYSGKFMEPNVLT